MIRFRDFLKKMHEEAPINDPAMQLQQLQHQLNDPRTPPQAKQQIQQQIQQLQTQVGNRQQPPVGQPQTQNAPPGTTMNPSPYNMHPGSPSMAYKWVNGKPVPVNMAQS